MAALKTAVQYLFVAAVLGGAGYAVWIQAAPILTPPCSSPIEYSIGSIDSRYAISTSAFEAAVKKAADVWNAEAGKPLLQFVESGGMPVNLIYSPEQETATLGKAISADQAAFDDAKAKLDALKSQFDVLKSRYDENTSRFNASVKQYQDAVASWNAKGGAPHPVYVELQSQQQELNAEQQTLNKEVDALNALSNQINSAVAVLNAAAKQINANVNVYNRGAGSDFEQGEYKQDADGKRISIFEYKDTGDLTRVLAHEFGHAIGLGHVENPASIMYSYNIASGLTLSSEDIAELKAVCKLK